MDDTPRGAAANYPLMSNQDIKNLPIKDLIDLNGSILALWVPSSLLQDGLDTMKAWGFNQKQTYVWLKTKKLPLKDAAVEFLKMFKDQSSPLFSKGGTFNVSSLLDVEKSKQLINNIMSFGMGRLFRQTHEICLIGTSSNKIYQLLANKSQRSVSLAENLKHSAKPENLQDSLDLMFPNTQKLELFARRHRPNWVCLGNELCQGEDIKVSLSKL